MNATARRLIGPGAITMIMLAILIGLGIWQVHRLAWKRGLLADIARAETAPGVALPAKPGRFLKVHVTGRFHYEQSATYGVELRRTAEGDMLGAQIVTPLFRADGPPILVDRGWAPTDHPVTLAQPAGEVTVEGYVRPSENPGLFSPGDDPAKRVFYTLDTAKIGAALGLGQVAPFTLVALGPPPPQGYPEPATSLPRPPNDHLSYAITWFGLAATLLVIFLLYARKVTAR